MLLVLLLLLVVVVGAVVGVWRPAARGIRAGKRAQLRVGRGRRGVRKRCNRGSGFEGLLAKGRRGWRRMLLVAPPSGAAAGVGVALAAGTTAAHSSRACCWGPAGGQELLHASRYIDGDDQSWRRLCVTVCRREEG